jgi:putative methionine-R-sulfoxide reductase with GAF domain
VIPVLGGRDTLLAVLDADSAEPNAFDHHDQRGLERIVAWFAEQSP